MGEFTFAWLQEQMKPWVQHNFGDRPASQPLRGIVEEFGELMEAYDGNSEDDDGEKAQDAVADILIFMCDYCNTRGYSMNEVVAISDALEPGGWRPKDANNDEHHVLRLLGKLNHHDLKKEQGIRKGEDHDEGIHVELGRIVNYLRQLRDYVQWELTIEQLADKTWKKVSQRDWKKNPAAGVS